MKSGALLRARNLLAVGVFAALVVPLAAHGGTSANASPNIAMLQKKADLYDIDQIEVKFHRATSTHNLKLMMSLWAPGALFNVDQQTLTGKAQIKHWFATENKAFRPNHHWESDTPSYKIKVSLHGDQATIYFECHYIQPNADLAKARVMAIAGVTHTLQKINGKWLITNSSGSTATLSAN